MGQGPLVKVMPLAHVGSCFAVFANFSPPLTGAPSTISSVVRDARTGDLLESFARPVDINSIVGWLLLAGDRYIQTCADLIDREQLVPSDQGRCLWFELDRVSGVVRATDRAASQRMEEAWNERWPDHLVMVTFEGDQQTLRALTQNVGVGGWEDMPGQWARKPS